MTSSSFYQQAIAQIKARQAAQAALPKPSINVASVAPIAGAPQVNVLSRTRDLFAQGGAVQKAATIFKQPLTQETPQTPDVISGHSGDSAPVNSNGGYTGVAPLALTSGVQSDLTGSATDTGSQAENAKSFIQIIAVAALIWFGWGFIEKRH